jgi:CTP synthase (UTP-ammonia lyase)
VSSSPRAADAGPEALELAEYPFFLATAFQPQVGTRQSGELHPILSAWLRAAAVSAPPLNTSPVSS